MAPWVIVAFSLVLVEITSSQQTLSFTEHASQSQAGAPGQPSVFSLGAADAGSAAAAVASERALDAGGDSDDEPAPDVEAFVHDTIDAAYKKALPMVTRFGFDPSVSAECSQSLLKMALAFRRLEPWAIRSEWVEDFISFCSSGRSLRTSGVARGKYFS
ncbi:hypothetical protein V5799_011785 [Amblyomma americanum]|uniref:Secreted protein n=1 Tax=Amblyomma americanum TaxID=6943 RepID=A0AAQ4EG78_AMBAM